MHSSFYTYRELDSNGRLTPYGAQVAAEGDPADPRPVTRWRVCGGLALRDAGHDWGRGCETGYAHAVETVRDDNTTMEMREGGAAPAPRQLMEVA